MTYTPPHMTRRLKVHPVAGKGLATWLRRHALSAMPFAAPQLRELSIVLVGDAGISRLHQQFFDDSSTTDVITFPLELDRRGRATSGELYLCVPMARRQARRRGIDPKHELLLYAIHGMLHLAGYVDTNARDYAAMHRREDQILQRLGIGAVFDRQVKEKH